MLTSLETILREAGALIASAHCASSDVHIKPGSANFVTEYDLRVQEMLRDRLASSFPGTGFVGEEDTENTAEDFHAAGMPVWVVDPIDGTTNFMHGYQHSCISAALWEGEKPLIAGIYDPFLDEMFTAESGKGAFVNGKRMQVANYAPTDAIISFGTTPYDKAAAPATFAILAELYATIADLRRSGSAALDLAYVAAGRVDGFFELLLSPWDFAAGVLLVREAGGMISDFNGNAHKITAPSSVLAASPALYDTILAAGRLANHCSA